ncbi:amidohydrolase family protein [Bradyrhizobium sp. CCBAU 51753]|uniref:amidohydrolase family protein n=1 Tax=Bradyrhizobium sp. CCBAU 51753 TaxID=1325100 RepID=UPI00188A4790
MEQLLADGRRLVFRDFGLADSARDPAWDPRLERLLALAEGAEVWVKLSGIGRVADDWAKAAAGSLLKELGPRQLLWGSEWPPMPMRHPMLRTDVGVARGDHPRRGREGTGP